MSDWTKTFFEEEYEFFFEKWSASERDDAVKKIMHLTNISSGHVFDQCCGAGVLLRGMLDNGFSVQGVDQSSFMIEKAKELCHDYPDANFVCADAGGFTACPLADLSISWHTSLGYGGRASCFEFLDKLLLSTKPSGKILLDIRHVEHYKRQPVRLEKEINWRGSPARLIREGVWDGQTLFQKWTVVSGQERLFSSETSCYHISRAELSEWALSKNKSVRFFGDFSADTVRWHHPRVLALFQPENKQDETKRSDV